MSWLYAEPPLRPTFAVVTGVLADEVPAGDRRHRSAVRTAGALRARVAEHRR
jgi:hypothetical protein